MTKQEEIREGVQDILRRYGNFVDGYDADGDEIDIDEALEAIVNYLDSQGVVIKIDRELPEKDYYSAYPNIIDKAQQDMLKAGYSAWEPLV